MAVLGLAAAALGFVAESTKSEASYAQHLHPPHLCSSNLISAAGSLFVPGSTSIHRSIGRARAGFCRLRRAALRVPAYAGARLRRRRGAARADGAGHRHRGQRMSPTRRARHRPQARRRRQAVHHRLVRTRLDPATACRELAILREAAAAAAQSRVARHLGCDWSSYIHASSSGWWWRWRR